jgi:hypothetical protein
MSATDRLEIGSCPRTRLSRQLVQQPDDDRIPILGFGRTRIGGLGLGSGVVIHCPAASACRKVWDIGFSSFIVPLGRSQIVFDDRDGDACSPG